jgi:hypothetical protein
MLLRGVPAVEIVGYAIDPRTRKLEPTNSKTSGQATFPLWEKLLARLPPREFFDSRIGYEKSTRTIPGSFP